jgi:hypothetical protein
MAFYFLHEASKAFQGIDPTPRCLCGTPLETEHELEWGMCEICAEAESREAYQERAYRIEQGI